MSRYERKIPKDIYDHALQNRNCITKEDFDKVFTISEMCGYGVYSPLVFERDGEYFVGYCLGSSCD